MNLDQDETAFRQERAGIKFRLKTVALFCVPIVMLGIVFREAIFFDRMYYNGDTMLQFFQYFNFFAEGTGRIAHGILSGFPLDTTVTGVWYYPVNKLFLWLFDAFGAYKFLILFDLVLAYVFSFLYARKIGLRFETSILTAMVFLFSGQLMLWSTTATNANYFFLLPAVLLSVEFLRTSKRKLMPLLATGVLLGVGWLSGHIQFIVYIHLFIFAYYLFFEVAERAGATFKTFIRKSIDVGIAFAISLAVGFPQIKAIIGFLGQTSRAAGVTLHEFFSGSLYPQDLIHFVLPFWQNPVIPTGVPSIFIGVLPTLVLLFSAIAWKKFSDSRVRFFLGTYIVCLVTSVVYSPIALALFAIPYANSFREWSRVMFIGNFAAAIAVGFTLEYLVLNYERVTSTLQTYLRAIRWILCGVFIPLVVIVSILKIFAYERFQGWIHAYVENSVYPRGAGFPLEHYLNLADQYINEAFGQLFIGNRFILIALAVFAGSLWLLKRSGRLSYRTFASVSVLITAFNFVGVYGAYFHAVPRTLLLDAPETVRAIQEKAQGQGPYRIFSLFPGISEYNELVIRCGTRDAQEVLQFQKSVLTPNMNMLWGLDSIDAYENYMPVRVAEMLAFVGSERATVGELVSRESIPLHERVKKVTGRKNVLRSMNVRFVLSHEIIDDIDFVEIFHEKVGQCGTDVYVYELSNPWPRYFVTGSYRAVPPGVSNMFGYSSDYLTRHTLADGVLLEKNPSIDVHNQGIQIVNPEIIRDQMVFRIEAQKLGLLFIGNAWLPGWRATVNGNPVGILRSNYIYMAIPLEAGENKIELKYGR